MTERNIEGRVDLLEYRMDKAEAAGREYRASLHELSATLGKLSKNIDQIKWVVIGGIVASMGTDGFGVVLKLLGL